MGPGIALACATILALLLANSPWAHLTQAALHQPIFFLSLHAWINDGLMALFFFTVGMEIKRELLVGELASYKRAAFPAAAALGGMLLPALIYFCLNPDLPAARGWGIPMATDIAFAMGVLSLFGKRVPASLKVFLLALATVDDLGAVLVIALFYTTKIHLLYAFGTVAALSCFHFQWKMRRQYLFGLLAAALAAWACMMLSGVHATVAGVLLGLLMPLSVKKSKPVDRLLSLFHPWISYGVMPLFALANAGLSFRGSGGLLNSGIFYGVSLGLFLGKPLGIFVFAWAAVRSRIAEIPRAVTWPMIVSVGFLGGIGFTMALFVSTLALGDEAQDFSKAGILFASLAAGCFGSSLLYFVGQRNR